MKKTILYILTVVVGMSSCDINLPIDKTATETDNQGTFIDQRDGQVYHYKQIGNTVWMTDNLRYLPKVYGLYTNSQTEARYYVWGYNGNDANAARNYQLSSSNRKDIYDYYSYSHTCYDKSINIYQNFGVLYNYVAAVASVPSGWRLPTAEEYAELYSHIKSSTRIYEMNSAYYYNYNYDQVVYALSSGKMREYGMSWLYKYDDDDYPAFGTSGFNMFPAGKYQDSFVGSGQSFFWTSDGKAISNNGNEEWTSSASEGNWAHGMSVRCVKK